MIICLLYNRNLIIFILYLQTIVQTSQLPTLDCQIVIPPARMDSKNVHIKFKKCLLISLLMKVLNKRFVDGILLAQPP